VEDFDALADYIGIFKKQFERKVAAETPVDREHELDKLVRDNFNPPNT
jgi:hypothetical protein